MHGGKKGLERHLKAVPDDQRPQLFAPETRGAAGAVCVRAISAQSEIIPGIRRRFLGLMGNLFSPEADGPEQTELLVSFSQGE